MPSGPASNTGKAEARGAAAGEAAGAAGGAAAAAAAAGVTDVNKLAALAMRAKLRGDSASHAELTARMAAIKAKEAQREEDKANVVVVPALDGQGRPLAMLMGGRGGGGGAGGGGGGGGEGMEKEDMKRGIRRGKLKHSKVGAEEHLVGDELTEWLRQERAAGAGDMDKDFIGNVLRLGDKYKGTELGGRAAMGGKHGEDEEEEVDMRMFQRPEDRMTAARAKERQMQVAIAANSRHTSVVEQCRLCMESPSFNKGLLLSLGDHTLLCLASQRESINEGHCLILARSHVAGMTACDEEVWREVEQFKAALRAMAAAEGQHVLFLETSPQTSSGGRNHAHIQAFVVPREIEMDAPLYFKQGLLEAAEEWATNKKVISCGEGGIRRAVPKGFPYFHVEWNGGGYAHVIETPHFSETFGVEVLCGMLGVEPPRFDRKGKGGGGGRGGGGSQSQQGDRVRVKAFMDRWSKYDWTKDMDG